MQVTHAAGANLDVNLTAFLLTGAGRVEDDSGMVFFNAPVHASGSATFTPCGFHADSDTHSTRIRTVIPR
ncbi:TerD family protein [Pseudomonas sp. FFUP_PS_41]|uniref:TerD family protein n=1 Tax=Pseudomonas sp. FFUP_PS_41 TaxID=2060417 RepID=UPI00211520DD|nr:TerD family protein [Pseudomonas sp. FFUP_PS_41]